MKGSKRALSLILALAATVAVAASAVRADDVPVLDSGMTGMRKLTQAEIAAMFAAETEPDRSDLFARESDYEAPYEDAGQISASHEAAALTRLNDLRRLAGLPAVGIDGIYSELAQAASYADMLYGDLTHYPKQAEGLNDAVYSLGAQGAGSSNIAMGCPELKFSVDLWVEDTDVSNMESLGHRRWALNPDMGMTGFGFTYRYGVTYAAMYAFDQSGAAGDYDYISWPASGFFPTGQYFFSHATAWSVMLNLDKFSKPSIDDVKVTLRRESDGALWEFSGSGYGPSYRDDYFNVDRVGYGAKNAIIFRPAGIEEYEGRYTVTVTGLTRIDGEPGDFSYSVDFFDLESAINGKTAPEFTDLTQSWQREAVEFVYSHGKVMEGVSDGLFDPGAQVDLGTALTVMARLDGVDTRRETPWYKAGFDWGHSLGLTESESRDDSIDRQELVYMLWIVAGRPKADAEGLASWDDSAGAEPEYLEALAWAVGADILRGRGDNMLHPTDHTSRAELAAFVMRAFTGGFFG